MANVCLFEMKLVGKKEGIEQFMRYIEDYSTPDHFRRMEVESCYEEEVLEDGYISRKFCGQCAWSLHSAGTTVVFRTEYDLFANAVALCNVSMEAWSEECGMQFQEHFLYKHGEKPERYCTDWTEYYYSGDIPFDEWCKENDLPSDIELDENDCYSTGGFDDYGTWRI